MKLQKPADERGLVAELLRYALDIFIAELLHGFNDLITNGEAPRDWRKILFKMLPKILLSKIPADCRPTVNIRLFDKVFA